MFIPTRNTMSGRAAAVVALVTLFAALLAVGAGEAIAKPDNEKKAKDGVVSGRLLETGTDAKWEGVTVVVTNQDGELGRDTKTLCGFPPEADPECVSGGYFTVPIQYHKGDVLTFNVGLGDSYSVGFKGKKAVFFLHCNEAGACS